MTGSLCRERRHGRHFWATRSILFDDRGFEFGRAAVMGVSSQPSRRLVCLSRSSSVVVFVEGGRAWRATGDSAGDRAAELAGRVAELRTAAVAMLTSRDPCDAPRNRVPAPSKRTSRLPAATIRPLLPMTAPLLSTRRRVIVAHRRGRSASPARGRVPTRSRGGGSSDQQSEGGPVDRPNGSIDDDSVHPLIDPHNPTSGNIDPVVPVGNAPTENTELAEDQDARLMGPAGN